MQCALSLRNLSSFLGIGNRRETQASGLRAQPSDTVRAMQDQIGSEGGALGQEETVAALQAEVARLEEAQSIQRAADTALDSLQDKIAVLKVGTYTVKHCLLGIF